METINVRQAKARFRRLLDRVAGGGTFIITKAGKPVAKVVPVSAPEVREPKRLGFMTGQLRIPFDFDRMGEKEIEALFVGQYPGPIRKI
ncbi:MAG: type II toxin-antitoxin system Phd/YefM family antitoxin [Sphingomonas sp.]|nr:type II toxin-antitoxin system Phd/YefM family antitoxin [Sphingomonas sp.]